MDSVAEYKGGISLDTNREGVSPPGVRRRLLDDNKFKYAYIQQ